MILGMRLRRFFGSQLHSSDLCLDLSLDASHCEIWAVHHLHCIRLQRITVPHLEDFRKGTTAQNGRI
jgi:hypothetical protein